VDRGTMSLSKHTPCHTAPDHGQGRREGAEDLAALQGSANQRLLGSSGVRQEHRCL